MCAILKPWIIASIGACINIVSVVLAGYFVSVRQKKKLEAEDERIRLQKALDDGFRQLRDAEVKNNFAELLLVMTQGRELPAEVISDYNARVAQIMVNAIILMTCSVTGDGPQEEEKETLEQIENQARYGDQSYFPKLRKIYTDLEGNYAERHNAFAAQRDSLKARESRLNASIERIRYSALGCQIFGLILVLMKDLVRC